MEKAGVSFKPQTEENIQQLAHLLSPLWNQENGDLPSFLKELQETKFSGKDGDAIVEEFDKNAQELPKLLDSQKRASALFLLQQLIYSDSAGMDLGMEATKTLAECFLFFSHLEDQDDIRHFYERFHRNVEIDPSKDDETHLERLLLKHLSEMMIIIAMSNKMGEEDIEFIFSNVRKEWDGNGKEVGPFLNDIFKEVEVRENIGQDLVAHFKEVTEGLEKMCNKKQKKKVMEIIQGLIDADSKISVQEKILYKIVKSTMGS
ncbi:MAG: hypothetical protein HQM13_15235 [SAR324 cluster bacterium]|nr:hypothetical protein [SAR324 cluster bacterium]